jgi:uncharacterized Ntn-hydrolase superfamily protein
VSADPDKVVDQITNHSTGRDQTAYPLSDHGSAGIPSKYQSIPARGSHDLQHPGFCERYTAGMKSISTFSLVAKAANGDLGVAVASKFLAVGSAVPWVTGGVGAVATQSYANTSYGPRALQAMANRTSLEEIAAEFSRSDEGIAQRQYGLVNAAGQALTFTGSACHNWAGGRTGAGYAAQGNLLAGPQVVDALANTFETRTDLEFPTRMLAALLAADRAGGDMRGRQSAALYIARVDGGYGGFNDRYIDLRVDDHVDPVVELERLLSIQRLLFERPKESDLLPLTGETARRLMQILVKLEHLKTVPTSWDETAQNALESLAGIENLEERIVAPRDGNYFVDPIMLEFLEDKFGR